MGDDQELKPREKAFVMEYLTNGYNATRAYLKAHPRASPETAAANGYKLLRNAQILAAIKAEIDLAMAGRRAIFKKRMVDAAETRAFFEPADILTDDGRLKKPLEELKAEGLGPALDQIGISVDRNGFEHCEYRLADRAKALDQLRDLLKLGEDETGDQAGATRIVVLPQTMTIEEWNDKYAPKDWVPL